MRWKIERGEMKGRVQGAWYGKKTRFWLPLLARVNESVIYSAIHFLFCLSHSMWNSIPSFSAAIRKVLS